MASGVGVNDEVVNKYNDIKLGHKYKYLILKISDDNVEIVIEKIGELNAKYEDFVADLPTDDCRYAVYDFDYETPEGGQRNKLVFFVWAPDSAKIKKKMLVASSKDAVRKKLIGISTEIQATDLDEVDFQEVYTKVSSGKA